MEFTLVPILPILFFHSQKLKVTWKTKSSRFNFSKDKQTKTCGSWQNNLGPHCFLVILCISENFVMHWTAPYQSVLGSKEGRTERMLALIIWDAQALSLVSSVSVEVRPMREGKRGMPNRDQGQSSKMSSGDSEWLLAVFWPQSGHTVPCRPWLGARTTVLVLERQCGHHVEGRWQRSLPLLSLSWENTRKPTAAKTVVPKRSAPQEGCRALGRKLTCGLLHLETQWWLELLLGTRAQVLAI